MGKTGAHRKGVPPDGNGEFENSACVAWTSGPCDAKKDWWTEGPRQELLFLKLLDADIPERDRQSVILETDQTRAWALGELSAAHEVVGVHVHVVQHDNDFVIEMPDGHLIPFASRLGCRPVRREPGNDAPGVVIG